ncbi:MAG: Fe-S cluster assembly protein SufD [Acidobacteria bacterium]|nr:Fe-S cluster assembly protein SufD [Acidobacteriota bacterium]
MIQVAEEKDIYLSHFARLEAELSAQAPSWLHSIRQAAMDRFAQLGFPTTRKEDWRFTNVAPIVKIPFQLTGSDSKPVIAQTLQHFTFGQWVCHQIVFINGHFSQELSSLGSLPKGVLVQGLGTILTSDPERLLPHLARYASWEEHAFVALNTAFIEDGAFVYIPKGMVVEDPIHLLFISTGDQQPTISHPRTLIVAEANSQAKIVQSYVGLEGSVYFTNAVTELEAGENAVIDHYKLQRESVNAFHIATLQVHQERSATVSNFSLSLGGALARHDVNVVLDGEGAECTLNGFYVVRGRQHVDHHTRIEHAKPHGTSREFYKGILDEHARGVFDGTIVVQPGAQKTDAQQTNKNLLLSTDALVNTNPRLQIFADDVKCSHGATIGQLDADAIFYLRSRGLSLTTAREILTYAFANDITSRIKIGPLRTGLECLMLTRLPQGQRIMEGL